MTEDDKHSGYVSIPTNPINRRGNTIPEPPAPPRPKRPGRGVWRYVLLLIAAAAVSFAISKLILDGRGMSSRDTVADSAAVLPAWVDSVKTVIKQ